VIQHVSNKDLVRYVVRAYDLPSRRLLPRAIVDKRNAGEVMRGYPVSRATTPTGDWVYTLYTRNAGSALTFVHALRPIGATVLVASVAGTALPRDFAEAVAYGDLATSVLAVVTLLALRSRLGFAIALVWVRTSSALSIS